MDGGRKVDKWEVYMKIKQLLEQGFKVSNIARNLEVSRTTVYKYLENTPEDMAIWMSSTKIRTRKLDRYHHIMLSWLKEHPDLSSSQILDWLQERYEDTRVGESTVRAYVAEMRETYHIPKVKMKRDYEAIPDPPMGQQAQVDFGQSKQRTSTGKELKLHFICFVLSHSRFKIVVWLDRPFTTRDVIRAHEYAFSKLGGMLYELVYDQDHLIVVSENAGDLLLTAEFQSYRDQRNFKIHLCRKADPESKGKIENVVGFIKKNFAKHRVFHNLDK
jgi:transposase